MTVGRAEVPRVKSCAVAGREAIDQRHVQRTVEDEIALSLQGPGGVVADLAIVVLYWLVACELAATTHFWPVLAASKERDLGHWQWA